MIVSRANRYVFLSMPRTASHSVSHWLRQRAQGDDTGTCYHDFRVPEEFLPYHVFTFVRDPFTWLPSMWRQAVRVGELSPLATFGEFVACMRQRWDWAVPQAEWVRRCPRAPDTVLRYEALPTALLELPFIEHEPSLPRMVSSDLSPAMLGELYASGENRGLVLDFCAEDFDTFRYSTTP